MLDFADVAQLVGRMTPLDGLAGYRNLGRRNDAQEAPEAREAPQATVRLLGEEMVSAYSGQYGTNLSQYQQDYQDRYNAAAQVQQVRLAPGELEKIVEAVVARLARLVDREKLAEEFDPIC